MAERTKLTKEQKGALLRWVGDGLRSDEIRQKAESFSPPFWVSRALVDYYRKTRLLNFSDLSSKSEGQILQEWRDKWAEKPIEQTSPKRATVNKRATYLYVLKESFMGLIKIGITSNLADRIKHLNTACPQEIVMLGFVESKHAPTLEAHIHQRFADKRVKGEWFNLDDRDVSLILEFCNASIPVGIPEFEKIWVE